MVHDNMLYYMLLLSYKLNTLLWSIKLLHSCCQNIMPFICNHSATELDSAWALLG